MKASPELQALVEEALLREGWEVRFIACQYTATHGGIGITLSPYTMRPDTFMLCFLSNLGDIVDLPATTAIKERYNALVAKHHAEEEVQQADRIALATERLREYLTAKKPTP